MKTQVISPTEKLSIPNTDFHISSPKCILSLRFREVNAKFCNKSRVETSSLNFYILSVGLQIHLKPLPC